MKVKVSKHGNSLGFNIPAQAAALEVGREYELSVDSNGSLIFRPLLTIEDLLANLPTAALAYEEPWETAPPVGLEGDWL